MFKSSWYNKNQNNLLKLITFWWTKDPLILLYILKENNYQNHAIYYEEKMEKLYV